MLNPLSGKEVRQLKSRAQTLKATLKVGKAGLSDALIRALNDELDRHELIKVKFDELKEQKKILAPLLAEKTQSHLITRIGNVAVLYRQRPEKSSEARG
jgi:RNA-binding protein